jgi:hypothetical protein
MFFAMKPRTAWLLAAAAAGPALGLVLAQRWATRRLRRDARRLLTQAAAAPGQTYHAAQLAGLPAPVQRYFRHVLREGQPYLRGVRLRQAGSSRPGWKMIGKRWREKSI